MTEGSKSIVNRKNTQQYVGYILSMARAITWDNSAMECPNDEASFERACEIVSNMFEREISKNPNRLKGMESHFDDIGSEVKAE